MIHSDIPLSGLITSKSLATRGRSPRQCGSEAEPSSASSSPVLMAWTPEPSKRALPLPHHLLLQGGQKRPKGHGEKRLRRAVGTTDGTRSQAESGPRHGGRIRAEDERGVVTDLSFLSLSPSRSLCLSASLLTRAELPMP